MIMGDFDYRDIYDALPKDRAPKLGPIFITRNGRFVNVGEDGEHGDIFGDGEYDADDYYALEDLFGLIKANGGNRHEPVPYIDLWEAPNDAQMAAIIEWLYLLMEHGRKALQVNSGNGCFELDLSSGVPEDLCDDMVASLGRIRECDAEPAESRAAQLAEELVYHGSSKEIDEFSRAINWMTPDKGYAEEFALFAAESGYVYSVEANISDAFDCGCTDGPCYGLMPIAPYQFGDGLRRICDSLGVDDEEMRGVLESAAEEYGESMGGYRMRLRTLVRSDAFAGMLKSLGYRCMRCVEGGHEAYGMLYPEDLRIAGKEKISTN